MLWCHAGSMPNVGQTPKLHTTTTDTVGSKTGAGAPNPLTHPKDTDHTHDLTTNPPLSSAFKSGTSSDSKPGACSKLVIIMYHLPSEVSGSVSWPLAVQAPQESILAVELGCAQKLTLLS